MSADSSSHTFDKPDTVGRGRLDQERGMESQEIMLKIFCLIGEISFAKLGEARVVFGTWDN